MKIYLRVILSTFFGWISINSQEIPKKIVHPNPIPAIYNDSTSDSQIIFDSGVNFAGQGYFIFENKLYIWEVGKEFSSYSKMNLPISSGSSRKNMLKFRNDSFWIYSDGNIYQFDMVLNRWSRVLEPDCNFNQFDITPDGKIVLIGVSRNSIWKTAAYSKTNLLIPLDFTTINSGKLIEIWEIRARESWKTIDYSEEIADSARQVSYFSGFNRSWIYNDWLILYSPDFGKMIFFNLLNYKTINVKVPWKTIDSDFLKLIGKNKRPEEVCIYKNGMVNQDIQFVFSVNENFLYFKFPVEKQTSLDQLVKIKNDIGQIYKCLPINWGPDYKNRWGRASINFSEGKLEFVEYFDRQITTPFWPNSYNDLILIEKLFIKPLNQTTVQAEK